MNDDTDVTGYSIFSGSYMCTLTWFIRMICFTCFSCRCGNVNWARRSDCNMCGQPKFAKVESRTGKESLLFKN